MTVDDRVSHDDQDTSDRFFGDDLPLELGRRRAIKIYLARFLTVVGAGFVVLLLGYLGALWSLAYILALWAALLVAVAVWALWRDLVEVEGRAVRWRARFFFPTMFVLFPATAVTAGALAVVSDRGSKIALVAVCVTAMVVTFLLGKVTLIRAEIAAEKTVEQSLQGVALISTAQPLLRVLGELVSAATITEKRSASAVLNRLTVGVAKAVCGHAQDPQATTRAIFYELESDTRLVRRAFEGTYDGHDPRRYFDSVTSMNDRRVVEIAKGDRVLVVSDVDLSPPEHFADYRGRPYKSFIAVPVRAGDRPFGALLIDSNVPKSFTDLDVGYAILLAGIIAAGLAAANPVESPAAPSRPNVDPTGEIALGYDILFAQDLPRTAVSFSLSPILDREILEMLRESRVGETRDAQEQYRTDALERYQSRILDLARKRARRNLRQMNHRSTLAFWSESTEPAYGAPASS